MRPASPASTNAGSFGTFNEFTGNGGDDNLTGNGNTRISFTNATAGVTVDLAAGISFSTASGDIASVGTDHFTGVNAVQASMFADSLSGDANNNTFAGLGGNDFIDGRGGGDTASYNNIYQSTGGVSVDLARGIVTGDASIGTDTLRSIEGIQGTNAADIFVATNFGIGAIDPSTGVAYANVGNIGDNNLFEGLGGDDTIIGNGHTQLLFGNATGGVTITLRDGSVPGGGGSASGDGSVGHDTFVGVLIVTGSAFGDIFDATGFTGTTSAGSFGNFNSFQGLSGDDTIIGNGNTSISFVNASGGVIVDLAAGIASGDISVGHDSFVGVNNAFGSNFADTIFGSNNNDILTGNAGNDQFVFNASLHGTGHDLISDFNPGQDHIELDYTGTPGFDPSDASSFNAWLGSHATTVINDVLIDLNVDGASPGLDTILLKNVTISSLHASDFIVHP